MKPSLVIFDCDGVLVDSEPITNVVVARNLTGYGMQIDAQTAMERFVGGTMRRVADQVRAEGIDLPEDWVDEIYEEMYAALRQGTPLIPGVVSLLDQLTQAGVDFCVASNGAESKMHITLGQNDLLDRFKDAMFSAYTLGVAKPDPGLFLHAAKTMGAQPETCVVVEDSATGALAAKRAGIRCFGYAPHDDGAALAEQGAVVFADMAGLARLLEV